MAVIQEAFEVSDEILDGLLSGNMRRIGGVVRWAVGPNKGQIVKMLEPTNLNNTEEAAGLLTKGINLVKAHKGTVVIVGIPILIGGGIYIAYKHHKNKPMRQLQLKLHEYITALKNGDLSLSVIDELLDILQQVNSSGQSTKAKFCLSMDELKTILCQLKKYTMKLAEDNNCSKLTEKLSDTDNPFLDMQNFLYVQRDVLQLAA